MLHSGADEQWQDRELLYTYQVPYSFSKGGAEV